jgi:hypothetical protein
MIHYVNKDGRVNALYSTPSRYLAAKRATPGLALPLKTDDIFPYCSSTAGTDYWTGYFTSRPTLKAQVTAYKASYYAWSTIAVMHLCFDDHNKLLCGRACVAGLIYPTEM